MLERALLWVLIVLAIVSALSALASVFHKSSDRIECAFDVASVFILDDAKEG